MDFGLQFLARNNPPDVLIIIDADCQVSPDCLNILARQAQNTNRPVQALYLMHAPENKSLTQAIAEFAWLVKNQVRPLGLKRLGLPCQLMGTGMAFPWAVIDRADLAHGDMVEDMKLGIDLALQGYAPLFCPDTLVSSEFPSSEQVSDKQRTRWEHGHMATILIESPRLSFEGGFPAAGCNRYSHGAGFVGSAFECFRIILVCLVRDGDSHGC